MKKIILLVLFVPLLSIGQEQNYPYKWPMYNDTNVNLEVENPSFEINDGPLIMFDSTHKNFFIQSHLIKPLVDLLLNDGYMGPLSIYPQENLHLVLTQPL